MLLESIMGMSSQDESNFQMLGLIVSQLNLLLCLVNDVLDMKLIEMG